MKTSMCLLLLGAVAVTGFLSFRPETYQEDFEVGALDSGAELNSFEQTLVEPHPVPFVEPPAIPELHQEYMRMLAKRRRIQFKEATPEECRQELSESLGLEIRFDVALVNTNDKTQPKASIETREPVSHLTAIRLALNYLGLNSVGLRFEADHILLVPRDDHRAALRTLNLREQMDYSLAKRDQLIRETVNKFKPESWSVEAETWIGPGESVFEINAYHYGKDGFELWKFYHPNHYRDFSDPDVRSLESVRNSRLLGSSNEPNKEPVDKFAAVQRLRQRYGFESLVDRLNYEQNLAKTEVPKLSAKAAKRLDERDKQFSEQAAAKDIGDRCDPSRCECYTRKKSRLSLVDLALAWPASHLLGHRICPLNRRL